MRNSVDVSDKVVKRNATNVSVMLVQDNPDTRLVRQLFHLTTEERLGLTFFASAPRPSDFTAKQRLLFKKLLQRRLVQEIEYPCLDGPRWVLSELGKLYLEVGAIPTAVNIAPIGPAKVLQLPPPR